MSRKAGPRVTTVIDMMADTARPLGVLAVAIGLVIIWLGVAVVS